MKPKFIFVSGCPMFRHDRFDTYPELESMRPSVGIERFALLFDRTSHFTPELLEKNRLIHFAPGDCGYNSDEEKLRYSGWTLSIRFNVREPVGNCLRAGW